MRRFGVVVRPALEAINNLTPEDFEEYRKEAARRMKAGYAKGF